MHAVIFDVEFRQDYEGDGEAELDGMVEATKAEAGFVSGHWLRNDGSGRAVLVYDSEAKAREVADGAEIPPEASVTLQSVTVWAVERSA